MIGVVHIVILTTDSWARKLELSTLSQLKIGCGYTSLALKSPGIDQKGVWKVYSLPLTVRLKTRPESGQVHYSYLQLYTSFHHSSHGCYCDLRVTRQRWWGSNEDQTTQGRDEAASHPLPPQISAG
jgi:hypothetical protein